MPCNNRHYNSHKTLNTYLSRRRFGEMALAGAATLFLGPNAFANGTNRQTYPDNLGVGATCKLTLKCIGDLEIRNVFHEPLGGLLLPMRDRVRNPPAGFGQAMVNFKVALDTHHPSLNLRNLYEDGVPPEVENEARELHKDSNGGYLTLPFLSISDRTSIKNLFADEDPAAPAKLGFFQHLDGYLFRDLYCWPKSAFSPYQLSLIQKLWDLGVINFTQFEEIRAEADANGKCCGANGCEDGQADDYCEEVAPGECSASSTICGS